MRVFIVICFIILNILPSFADFGRNSNFGHQNKFQSKLKINQPKDIITSYPINRRNNVRARRAPHYHHNHHHTPYLASDINALEKYALNRTYNRENELQRLERLENLAFGTSQYGDIYSRFKNVEDAILSRPKYTSKPSVVKSIANFLGGQTTGFTPSITPYQQYSNLGGFSSNPYNFSPSYSNNSFEQYSNGIFGGGWGFRGNDFGNSSSIKILD